jgi:hypothetical protein
VIEFNQSQDGRLRPSDLGAPSHFSRQDFVRFGERVERPPDLSEFSKQLAKQKEKRKKAGLSGNMSGAGTNRELEVDEDDDSDSEGNKKKKRRRSGAGSSMDLLINSLDGDVAVGETRRGKGAREGIIHAGGGKASAHEMELLRARVQDAYKALKVKRKVATGAAVGTGTNKGITKADLEKKARSFIRPSEA